MNLFKTIFYQSSSTKLEGNWDYYNNLDFVPIYNFYKASEDFRYLLILDNYSKLPDVSESTYSKLEGCYNKLMRDYSGNNSSYSKINDLRYSIARLNLRYHQIVTNLNILRYKYNGLKFNGFEEIEKELSKQGYTLNYNNKIEFYLDLNRLFGKSNGLINQIEKKRNELDLLNNSEDEYDMFETVGLVSKTLDGVKIDIYTDTVSQFNGYVKAAKQLSKQG